MGRVFVEGLLQQKHRPDILATDIQFLIVLEAPDGVDGKVGFF